MEGTGTEGVSSPFSHVRVRVPWLWLREFDMYPLKFEEHQLWQAEPTSCLRRQKRGDHSHLAYASSFLGGTVYLIDQMGIAGDSWRGHVQPMEGQTTRCPGLEGRIRSVLQKKITAHDKNLVSKSSLWKKKPALETKNQHPWWHGHLPLLHPSH